MADAHHQGRPARIAVIAAANVSYFNPGMLTVDLAAAGVITRAVPHAVVSWYTLHLPEEFGAVYPYVTPSELPFTWLPLVEHFDAVCDHDVILLWGDFLQARHYFVQDAAERLVLSSVKQLTTEQALEVLYRCLLFSDAPLSVLSKIIIFGSSLLFNRQTDYSRDRYGEYLSRLLTHCAGVWAREPVSAAKIQHLRQDYSNTSLGTDSAFLLQSEDIADLAPTSWSQGVPFVNRVGFFFGARTRPPRMLMSFLRRVTQRLGLELEWVPWFPVHALLRALPRKVWLNPVVAAYILDRRRKIDRMMPRGTTYSVGDLLTAVAGYRFVVTDTYHLCVNAWRAGTPAICFGDPQSAGKHLTLDDHKKRVLYEMYDASDFHFSTSSLRSAGTRRESLERVLHILGDDRLATAVTARVHAHARAVEHALAARLSELAGAVTRA